MHIDFYYDFVSPYSYFASLQIPGLAREHGVAVRWTPVQLTRLLELAGNVSPVTVPKKARYLLRDLKRWGERMDVPFRVQRPPFFDSEPALLAALALEGAERERFSRAVFRALWTGAVSVGEQADWLARAAAIESLPGHWTQPDDVHALRERLQRNTDQASRDGAFGVPSCVLRIGGRRELYFGADRLPFLADALATARQNRTRFPAPDSPAET